MHGTFMVCIIIIIIKKRLAMQGREREIDSPKTLATHYQPIEEKKRKGK